MSKRGENIQELTIDHFSIFEDQTGKYIKQVRDELLKNHRQNDTGSIEGGRMYASNTKNCPVASFEKYISLLNPDCQYLFQRPKRNVSEKMVFWYDNVAVGVNTIEQMIRKISTIGNLSKIYTNHSIRATCFTILDQNNFEAH